MQVRVTGYFVWGTWLVMSLLALGFVIQFGPQIPFMDEWDALIPFYTGTRPLNLRTLWAPCNEHRLVIPKLILVGLDSLTNHNFRAGMFVNVFLLIAVSAMLIHTAKKVRGHLRWSDAFFPVLLLNWGHRENLLWSYQVQFMLTMALSCLLLSILVTTRQKPSRAAILWVGFSLLALPLCLAAGVAIAPVLACWLAAVGGWYWFSAESPNRPLGSLAMMLSVAAIALAAVAYVGRAHYHPPPQSWYHVPTGGIELLSMSFGPIAGKYSRALPIITAMILLASVVLLRNAWRSHRDDRLRVWGLLLFLAAFVGLGLGIAWGRRGIGPHAMFHGRYATLAAPFLCGIYFAWELYGRRATRRWICGGLCVTVFLFAPFHAKVELELARRHFQLAAAFERDIRNGYHLSYLTKKYWNSFHINEIRFGKRLARLHESKIGVFRFLNVIEP